MKEKSLSRVLPTKPACVDRCPHEGPSPGWGTGEHSSAQLLKHCFSLGLLPFFHDDCKSKSPFFYLQEKKKVFYLQLQGSSKSSHFTVWGQDFTACRGTAHTPPGAWEDRHGSLNSKAEAFGNLLFLHPFSMATGA